MPTLPLLSPYTKPMTNLREPDADDVAGGFTTMKAKELPSSSSSSSVLLPLKLSVQQQDILIKLESTLQQLYYRRRIIGKSDNKSNKNNNNNKADEEDVLVVSFATFTQLASKIDGQYSNNDDDDTTTTNNLESKTCIINDNDSSYRDRLLTLSREERIFHDFYCITVPKMYRKKNDRKDNNDDGNDEDRTRRHSTANFSAGSSPRRRRADSDDIGDIVGRTCTLDLVYIDLASAASAETTSNYVGSAPSNISSSSNSNKSNSNSNTNRFQELRRLIQDVVRRGIPRSKSIEVLQLLEGVAAARERQPQQLPPRKKFKQTTTHQGKEISTNTKLSVDDILGVVRMKNNQLGGKDAELSTTTTIEERIRSRAKERARDLEEAKKWTLDPRDERVAISDMLYAHACRLLKRALSASKSTTATSRFKSMSSSRFNSASAPPPSKQRASTTTATTTTTKCVITFGDVVDILSPRPRKEITRLLIDISNIYPGWINWTTATTTTARIPNDTKLTIETADYKRVRAVLHGQKLSDGDLDREHQHQHRLKQQGGRHQQQQQQQQLTPVPGTSKIAAVTISTKKYSKTRN